ncbi:redoxin domain-containing protein [bacterium]|nr:redoxin domain-containing protein [bacterium]
MRGDSLARPSRVVPGLGVAIALALAASTGRGEDRVPVVQDVAPLGSPVASGLKVMDTKGQVHTIGTPDTKATALVFLSTECPIAQKYVPELNSISRRHSQEGVVLMGVVSDPTLTRAAAAEHVKKYQLEFPLVFDASGELAVRFRPTHTPEAFVVGADGAILYRGRIDDQWRDLGKINLRVSQHDLDDAIAAVVAGKPVATAVTTPVGCAFEPWSTGALPQKVTWTRDVAPIVNMHCVSCHRPGAIAPFSLTNYEEVAKRVKTVNAVTKTRYMPPWHAEPGFGHFRDERRLSEREIALIAAWKDAGAPEGDRADLPPSCALETGWTLGEPDLVLKMPKAFEVPAKSDDIYRAFVLKADIPEDKFVTAIEFRPGAPTVVHHCITYLDTSGVARKKEAAAGGFGYVAFGGPGFTPSGSLGGWAPGATPSFLPDGMARHLPKKADIVCQIHYHPNGKAELDQSSVGIYFAKKAVTHTIHDIPLLNPNVDIPAGDSRYKREIKITLPIEVTVIGIVPHMHLLGREMKVTATTPKGVVHPGIWIKDWDFRWQDQYKYDKPYVLPRGTKIEVEAYYDNSTSNPYNPNSPPKRVTWGEQTTDEMCLCFVEIALPADFNPFGSSEPSKPAPAPKKKKYY